jgi:hypothetical protein
MDAGSGSFFSIYVNLLFRRIIIIADIEKSSMAFTIINGQIYTPGLAIIDAPQPYTPLGGGMPSQTVPRKTVSNVKGNPR